jgi:hypothetical protein
MLPKVNVWTNSSRANLRTRWREDQERQSLDWWCGFFHTVATSDFLTGRIKPWQADLGWLVKPANFEKVMNGAYSNRQPNGGYGSQITPTTYGQKARMDTVAILEGIENAQRQTMQSNLSQRVGQDELGLQPTKVSPGIKSIG